MGKKRQASPSSFIDPTSGLSDDEPEATHTGRATDKKKKSVPEDPMGNPGRNMFMCLAGVSDDEPEATHTGRARDKKKKKRVPKDPMGNPGPNRFMSLAGVSDDEPKAKPPKSISPPEVNNGPEVAKGAQQKTKPPVTILEVSQLKCKTLEEELEQTDQDYREKISRFEKKLAEKEETLKQQLLQNDESYRKELSDLEKRFEKLAEREETLQQQLLQKDESHRKELSEREKRFEKKLAEREETLQQQLLQKEESYRKELSDRRELSDLCASWEAKAQLLEKEKRSQEELLLIKEKNWTSEDAQRNEELQGLRQENTRLQELQTQNLKKKKKKCFLLRLFQRKK